MNINKTLADSELQTEVQILGFSPEASDHFYERLKEMGFLPGQLIKIVHEAPYTRDPIAVEIHGSIFGFRREDARQILVTNVVCDEGVA